MKTKREIEYHSYNATPSLVAVIPAGTSVIPATNLPSQMGYWAKNWEGMDSRAESWARNYGFFINPEDVR